MLELAIKSLLKFLGYFIPTTLKWYYTSSRLQTYIRMRVATDGDGVELWAGDLPHVIVRVVVTNLSPFPMSLDRSTISIGFGSVIAEGLSLMPTSLPSTSEAVLMFRCPLDLFQAHYVQKSKDQVTRINLSVRALILCRVNNLDVVKSFDTTHYKLTNFDRPVSAWMPVPLKTT